MPDASVSLSGSEATLQSMDRCTKCGLCQLYCPVSAVTDRFPGPKYSGPQAQRFRVIEAVKEAAPALCSGCGVCTSVCPNEVAITDIITLAKVEMARAAGGPALGQRLLDSPEAIGRIGGGWPGLANAVLANGPLRRLAERLLGIHRAAALPRFSGPEFRRWLRRRRQPDGPEVAYFGGCAVAHYDPAPGKALVEVMNRLGYRVILASEACCGLPLLSSGAAAAAAAKARRLVGQLRPAAAGGLSILSTSTSCSLAVRSKYAALLDLTEDDARLVAGAVRDACEFLREAAGARLANSLRPLRARALYHGPCQLRGHQMGQPAVELLRLVPDLELSLSGAACCGVAGTYGYGRDRHAIATAVGAELRGQIAEEGPDFIVCDSETCRWNIAAASGRPCVHPLEVLAASLSDTARRTPFA